MPKVVDPETRRDDVVEAVFRVIRRDGLEQASLRNVAAEAGLAIGSVRHYFAGHGELMVFAMRAMASRVERRLLAHLETLPVDPASMLSELLPLDETRRDEVTVWLAFTMAARTRPELRPLATEVYDGTRRLVTRILEGAEQRGRLRANLDHALETERLCALIDGLCVEGVLQPDRMNPSTMTKTLRLHLTALSADAS